MKTLSMLASLSLLLLLSACAKDYPRFPDQIKNHFVVKVRGEEIPDPILDHIENPEEIYESRTGPLVTCLAFDIVSVYPYKIKYTGEVNLATCNGVGGYQAKDTQIFFSWIDSLIKWAEDKMGRQDSNSDAVPINSAL